MPDRLHKRLMAGPYACCDAADWVAAWARASGFDDDIQLAMRLCVEELVTNLVMHGLGGDGHGHVIDLAAGAEPGWARVTMIDDGPPFDVATAAEPGRQDGIEAATVGGRGIRLMRGFAERLEWRNLDGRNHTSLVFKTVAAPDR